MSNPNHSGHTGHTGHTNHPHPQPLPRGVRNNNPGNIRHSGAAWLGRAQHQTDTAFVTFDTPEHGVRALARILINYQTNHHLHTTEEIIHRWAPPTENLTGAYVRAVAAASGIQPGDHIDLRHNPALLNRFVTAIIAHENGSPGRFGRTHWYDPGVIDRGVHMALPAPHPPHEDRSHQHGRQPHPRPTTPPPQVAPHRIL